jgi:dihydroorotase
MVALIEEGLVQRLPNGGRAGPGASVDATGGQIQNIGQVGPRTCAAVATWASRFVQPKFVDLTGLWKSGSRRIMPQINMSRGNAIMSALSRRHFLALTGSAAAAAMSQGARAAMEPADKFDLVIKGGEVLDTSQSLKAKRDIGIRWGMIEAVEAEIPAERALKIIDAAGKLVLPGLVDLHCHVYPYGSAIGIPADELVQFQGTTTVVSAGDAGVNNLAALRRFIVAQTRARMYAFVHIANNGLSAFPVAELYNIDNAQVEACAMALAENPDFLLGVKVRMSENVIFKHGLEPLKRGIKACEMCGWPAKMMVHIGGVETRGLMSDILDLLRPGDVLTHCYSGFPNMSGVFTNIVQDGKLLPAALAAKQRGVVFDVGHGGGSFDFTVAEVAIPGGCAPDTISSDIHVFSGNTPGMPFLPNVMSKFMAMGFSLEQVVAMATTAPAKIINRAQKIGTLQVGAPGDVTIMDLMEGPVTFVDTRGNKRDGKLLLKPAQTVINGVPFGRPYQSPFSVR